VEKNPNKNDITIIRESKIILHKMKPLDIKKTTTLEEMRTLSMKTIANTFYNDIRAILQHARKIAYSAITLQWLKLIGILAKG